MRECDHSVAYCSLRHSQCQCCDDAYCLLGDDQRAFSYNLLQFLASVCLTRLASVTNAYQSFRSVRCLIVKQPCGFDR